MEKIWKEASSNIEVEIETYDEISYLYLGYKITKNKETDEITIYNIRISDFYNEINENLKKRFLRNGFEKTCDELQIERDERRVKIADHFIMKAILNDEGRKKKRLQKERFNLLTKINKLKEKSYEK